MEAIENEIQEVKPKRKERIRCVSLKSPQSLYTRIKAYQAETPKMTVVEAANDLIDAGLRSVGK